jgi:UDP-N-acetylmuramate--alanine ligase
MMITHHPTEINAVYQAVRELYPDKKFLPCFSLIYSAEQKILLMILRKVYQFDELLLLDIYPARELPMEGITSSGYWVSRSKIRS